MVPLASTKNAPDRSAQDCEAPGNVQKTAQIAPESDREIGLRVRECAATARKAAQVKVRSKFCAKNVEATKSSKLALAEELATFIYSLSEVTLLTVAGALDSAGYRSASSHIAEPRLRHVELDFAISQALDKAVKKVNDACLSLGMTSLFLHEGMSGPGDVTLRLPTSKTDPRGNGASRRLTCICKLPVEVGDALPEACPVCAVRRQVSRLCSLFGWAIDDDRKGKPLFARAGGSRASQAQLVQAWGVATAQSPSEHSPRRSGAKRYARQGWSVWMIQFMGSGTLKKPWRGPRAA